MQKVKYRYLASQESAKLNSTENLDFLLNINSFQFNFKMSGLFICSYLSLWGAFANAPRVIYIACLGLIANEYIPFSGLGNITVVEVCLGEVPESKIWQELK